MKNGSPDTNHSSVYFTPWRSRIASTERCSDSTVCSVEKRRLKRSFISPGITFGAPVPAAMFEIWNDVGWKNSLPSSQCRRDQFGERGRKAVHRVVGEVRVGDVPLHAVNRQPARQ